MSSVGPLLLRVRVVWCVDYRVTRIIYYRTLITAIDNNFFFLVINRVRCRSVFVFVYDRPVIADGSHTILRCSWCGRDVCGRPSPPRTVAMPRRTPAAAAAAVRDRWTASGWWTWPEWPRARTARWSWPTWARTWSKSRGPAPATIAAVSGRHSWTSTTATVWACISCRWTGTRGAFAWTFGSPKANGSSASWPPGPTCSSKTTYPARWIG